MSENAKAALLFLAGQYRGHNNGDLTIAWKVARAAGLTSNGNLRRGTLELVKVGFVIQSRQGGRNRCSLFALAWFAIDDCNGKLDISASRVAPIDWAALDRGSLSEPDTVQCAPGPVQSEVTLNPNNLH